jgi:hypothetical protein
MFALRVDIKSPKLLQIKYLARNADHQYLNITDAYNSTGAETAVEPMDNWAIT